MSVWPVLYNLLLLVQAYDLLWSRLIFCIYKIAAFSTYAFNVFVLWLVLCWVFCFVFCLFVCGLGGGCLQLSTLQAAFRDQALEQKPISPVSQALLWGQVTYRHHVSHVAPSHSVLQERLSLKSTNTQDKHYLPITAYSTWEYDDNSTESWVAIQ